MPSRIISSERVARLREVNERLLIQLNTLVRELTSAAAPERIGIDPRFTEFGNLVQTLVATGCVDPGAISGKLLLLATEAPPALRTVLTVGATALREET